MCFVNAINSTQHQRRGEKMPKLVYNKVVNTIVAKGQLAAVQS